MALILILEFSDHRALKLGSPLGMGVMDMCYDHHFVRKKDLQHWFEDWSFWGQCLGVEGRSVAPFLTMCLVQHTLQNSCITKFIFHQHFMLRCKLCLDRKPRAIIFENVVPFPTALLKDVTGVVRNICVHTKCDHLIHM